MASRQPIVDFSLFDTENHIFGRQEIDKYNHQRYEMCQLDGILYESLEDKTAVGVKITSQDDFWVKGHMPGFPIMPGVIMCEAAAQLSTYFAVKHDMLGCDIIGLGGLESIRFRGSVSPGQSLVLMMRGTKVRRGGMICADFQGWADKKLIVEGEIKGIPLFDASQSIGKGTSKPGTTS